MIARKISHCFMPIHINPCRFNSIQLRLATCESDYILLFLASCIKSSFDLWYVHDETSISYPCLYAGDAWKLLLDAAGAIVPQRDQEVLNSLTKFVDQLPSVVNQVIL